MSTATAPAPWWKTAPNPPCVSWCTFDHPDDDLADARGGMLCIRLMATTPNLTLEVQRHVGTTKAMTTTSSPRGKSGSASTTTG